MKYSKIKKVKKNRADQRKGVEKEEQERWLEKGLWKGRNK